MGNWDSPAALEYHERTKHSFESVRRGSRPLDWSTRPTPFKDYPGAPETPLPLERPADGELSAPVLGWLLRWGAGIVRTRWLLSEEEYHFRTYSSAGALYPVELYVAWSGSLELGAGLYSFDPRGPSLRLLRRGDARPALAAAAADEAIAGAGAVLVLTGILWRTAWKYGERGYRHLYWDAGTMLANLLALADSAGIDARIETGFVDAQVNELLGVDGTHEASLALLAVGRATSAAGGELEPLGVGQSSPLREEPEFPEAMALHFASSLASSDDVQRYRANAGTAPNRDAAPLEPERLEAILRRRGSIREFAPDPIPRQALADILARATAPIPADFPPSSEPYVVVSAVEGLPWGAYRFELPGRLELLEEGNFRRQAGYLVLEQALGALAAAVVFFLADLEASVRRLGNRGYRAAQLEAGIRAGRVYLDAVSAGLGATASTFYDDDVTAFLAPGTQKTPLLCAAVGSRPSET